MTVSQSGLSAPNHRGAHEQKVPKTWDICRCRGAAWEELAGSAEQAFSAGVSVFQAGVTP